MQKSLRRLSRFSVLMMLASVLPVTHVMVSTANAAASSNTEVTHFSVASIKNGATDWQLQTNSATRDFANWKSIAYGNNTFVAVGVNNSGNQIMISRDGINWSPQTSAQSQAPGKWTSWNSVTFGNGIFVAVGSGYVSGDKTVTGNAIMTSPDGINWTARNAADAVDANNYVAVTYGNGLFVAVSSGGTRRLFTSSDGITWTGQDIRDGGGNLKNSINFKTLAYGNGVFVGLTDSGGHTVTSLDGGITFTYTQLAGRKWTSVTYGNGLFVAVSKDTSGVQIMTTPDGVTWTNRTTPGYKEWNSVAYGNGVFTAVASTGVADRIMTSLDGINWTLQASPFGEKNTDPITLTSISPSTGTAAGGTSVTVTGTGFSESTTVTIGGAVATNQFLPTNSASSITVTTPAGVVGASNVVVQNTTTGIATLTGGFTYTGTTPSSAYSTPTFTSVSPAIGTIAGGTTVTITGTGFVNGATVKFGTTSATGVVVNSPTSITAVTPAVAISNVDVVVTNPDTGSAKGIKAFGYTSDNSWTAITFGQGMFVAVGNDSNLKRKVMTSINNTVIDSTNHTITMLAPAGTDLTSLAPTITLADSGATISPATAVAQNFTSPVTYTVTASDGTTIQTWTVAVHLLPTLSSVFPFSGGSAGGTSITITGTGFVNGATVDIGGIAATGVVFNSSTSITAVTPAGIDGVADVVVKNPDTGRVILKSGFSYASISAPTFTSISPSTGLTTGGTSVTITGTGFVNGATVKIGGVLATNVVVNSATSITATTPAGSAGAVNVLVTNADTGAATGPSAYTYGSVAFPTFTSISPTSGSTLGGTSVTITGTGFLTGAIVKFGMANATNVVVNSPTSITAVAPALSAGTYAITVTNTDTGTVTSNNSPFTYVLISTPTFGSVTPSTGLTTGGTVVTITGTGFAVGAYVLIGDSYATNVTFYSPTSITATTPLGMVGPANILITNTDSGAVTGTNVFTYTAPVAISTPTFTSVSPSSATSLGGTSVTISGSGFALGASVKFGGVSATSVYVNSATSISATTPAGSVGGTNITITNEDTGTVTSNNNAFTYVLTSTPTFVSITPTSGSTEGGTTVTITGTGFVSGATVRIGGTNATGVTFNSSTSITATAPIGTAGTANVVITNPDSGSVTGTGVFTFNTPPPAVITPGDGGSAVASIPAGATKAVFTDPALLSPTISFSSPNSAASVTVAPANNPAPASSTPFTITGSTQVVDIVVSGLTGAVTVCLNGGPTAHIYHYTGGAWVDITTSHINGQVCGVTSSFSPFGAGEPIADVSVAATNPVQQSSITSISPSTGVSGSAIPVVITGKFVETLQTIEFNGVQLPSGSWVQTATTISFKVPSQVAGKYSMQLFNGSAPVLEKLSFTFTKPVVTKTVKVAKPKMIFLTCVKGKRIRHIHAVNAVCPVGYIKR